jgi:aminopeptidase N
MGSRLSYHDYLAFQSIVYNKTALVLYMLKDLLGEDVFFSALREFLNIQRYSPARTREFFAVFERISGQDLSLFFEKWFDSYLLPEISVKHSIQKSGDESFLSFRVVQAEGSFMFPLWLQWKEGGKERREKILVMETVQDFRFQVSSKPTGISINPDNVVPGIFR